MSKINAKPFTQSVIETLSESLQTKLVGLLNGSNQTPAFRSLVNASNYITNSDKNDVKHIILETWNKTYTGYLVYNATYCVLFAYSLNTQDLNIVKIDNANKTYNLVKEQLNILELRFILNNETGGVGTDVTDNEIDSGSATAGKVLMADGEGGAEWGNVTDIAVNVDFYDAENNTYQSALSDSEFAKLSKANIIYDYTNGTANGPIYYIKELDGQYQGGGYRFYRLDGVGTLDEVHFSGTLGHAITHYQISVVPRGALANEYSDSETYALNDVVWHGQQLYKCSTAIETAETWTPAHWAQITAKDFI